MWAQLTSKSQKPKATLWVSDSQRASDTCPLTPHACGQVTATPWASGCAPPAAGEVTMLLRTRRGNVDRERRQMLRAQVPTHTGSELCALGKGGEKVAMVSFLFLNSSSLSLRVENCPRLPPPGEGQVGYAARAWRGTAARKHVSRTEHPSGETGHRQAPERPPPARGSAWSSQGSQETTEGEGTPEGKFSTRSQQS